MQQIAVNTGIIADQLYISNAIGRSRLALELAEQHEVQREKYFKSLTFKTGQILDAIHEIENPVLKFHFYDSFFFGAAEDLYMAMNELDEIDDKTKAKEIEAQIRKTGKELSPQTEAYDASLFPKLYKMVADYEALEKSLPSRPSFFTKGQAGNPNKIKLTGILILLGLIGYSFFIFQAQQNFTYKERNNPFIWAFLFQPALALCVFLFMQIKKYRRHSQYSADKALFDQQEIQDYELKRKNIQSQLDDHPIFRHVDALKREYPQYIYHLNVFKRIESAFDEKWTMEAEKMKRLKRQVTNGTGINQPF